MRTRIPGSLKYFENNNLAISRNRKLDNAKYKVYQVFDIFNEDPKGVIKNLKELQPELRFILKKINKEYPDLRRGWETYGYTDPLYDLSYIEDRWLAAFRVQWLLDLFDSRGGNF